MFIYNQNLISSHLLWKIAYYTSQKKRQQFNIPKQLIFNLLNLFFKKNNEFNCLQIRENVFEIQLYLIDICKRYIHFLQHKHLYIL